MILTLARVIKKSPECMETLEAMPENAPSWLREKWDTQKVWHKFEPRKFLRLTGVVYGISVWLENAIEYEMEWLKNVDSKGRPKKLLKLSTFEQIYKERDADEARMKEKTREKWRRELKNEAANIDIMPVIDFEDGMQIVKLMTERALDRESGFLEHCIGEGGYDRLMQEGDLFYYSLRGPENIPYATISVNPHNFRTEMIAGWRNAMPDAKYMRYIATFCCSYSLNMAQGLMFTEGYTVKAEWDQDIYSNAVKPKKKVKDELAYLEFKDPQVEIFLPDELQASGLYISDVAKLKVFPKDVYIDGNVHFFGKAFPKNKPENWTVRGKIMTNLNFFETWDDFLAKHYPE